MSSNLGSSPRASVQRAEQTQTLNIHHSLSDKARFFENSLPRVADSGNGDLKRALAELVQMGRAGRTQECVGGSGHAEIRAVVAVAGLNFLVQAGLPRVTLLQTKLAL